MIRHIFVTGGSGFIGQRLINKLAIAGDRPIKVLTRKATTDNKLPGGSIEYVMGNLLEPETYLAALASCDAVLHLAAATGRASPREYERVNVEGTSKLLSACKNAGVSKFLYVSTIAAGYPDQRYYPYALTKLRAESFVRGSGLDFEIIRPTLVLGEKSPIWQTLIKIAGLPLIPLPEARPVRVQPIHVDDVVRGIERLLERERFNGEILELGGSFQMPFRDFLQLIQSARRKHPGKIISVPLAPLRFGLAAIEPILRPLMPVTAGQLSIFANDSTASENWLLSELRADMPDPDKMISGLLAASGDAGERKEDGKEVRRQARLLSDDERRLLEREFQTFATYLIGSPAGAYVGERYVMATQARGLSDDEAFSCFDRASVGIARRGPVLARCADAYCALLSRNGVLRRKLVLLAAILEHASPTNEAFDRVNAGSAVRTLFSLSAYGLAFALSLLLGAAVLFPANIVCWVKTRIKGPSGRRGTEL